MRARMWSSLVSAGVTALSCLAAGPAAAANTYAVNPAGFFYNTTWNHVADYQRPTAMLITGRCNRGDARFTEARARGAEVLAYVNVIEMPDGIVCSADYNFYTANDTSQPSRWLRPNGQPRVNYPNQQLLDIRAGSAWSDRAVEYIRQLMIANEVDGVFLDVLGARLMSELANWENDPNKSGPKDWTQAERDEWTAGAVDLVRRLDELREDLNPRFIIVNNGHWTFDNRIIPDQPPELVGESHVDGIAIEHHPASDMSKAASAGRTFGTAFGATPRHRRVVAIAENDADAVAWAQVQGVTHISNQGQGESYGSPARSPVTAFNRLVDRQKLFGRLVAGPDQSTGMIANQKRASKVTLSERGRLSELSAYLDGAGGASGSQLIKLVLYADNGGVPGAKLAESNQRTFNAGAPGRWYSFSLPVANQVLMNPGNYWIAIFTGTTAEVVRNYSEVSAMNWYSNADTYSDGAASSFGTGTSGNVTLSVRAGYTPE